MKIKHNYRKLMKIKNILKIISSKTLTKRELSIGIFIGILIDAFI